MKRVELFYDYACPYAYLAHTQIEALCARASAELVWRPMLLGGVFQALGTPQIPMTSMSAAKARHNALDMARWADHFGVPLTMPPMHPNRTVLALRATLAAEAEITALAAPIAVAMSSRRKKSNQPISACGARSKILKVPSPCLVKKLTSAQVSELKSPPTSSII